MDDLLEAIAGRLGGGEEALYLPAKSLVVTTGLVEKRTASLLCQLLATEEELLDPPPIVARSRTHDSRPVTAPLAEAAVSSPL